MNILVSGASGLIGTALVARLEGSGHQVFRLVRRTPQSPKERQWDPENRVSSTVLDRIDSVIHLAGENIAGGRWTAEKKRRIRDSRVVGTRMLAQAIADAPNAPKSFISTSAIGYYGDRGAELLDESSAAGTGFLPDVCVGWESACDPARTRGVRVVNARLGIVISTESGALAQMLTPFKLGVGGVVGSGKQYWSSISLEDAVSAFQFLAEDERLSGPVNLVSPSPATNFEFTKSLGKVLHRPTIFPMPAFAARLALGEMADALILSSARVVPKQLESHGFRFAHPTIDDILRHAINSGH